MDFQIEHDENAVSPDWDAFVVKCAVPHFEQTTLWGQVKAPGGWKASRVIVRVGGQICAGAQVLSRKIRFGGAIGYIFRGPLATSEEPVVLRQVAAALKAHALQQRVSCLIVVPPYRSFPLVEELGREGFGEHPDFLPPTGIMQGTAVLDLRPDLGAIFANVSPDTRRNIRRGQNNGVTVRPGVRAELKIFWDLLMALCSRRNTHSNVPGLEFLETLWDVFHPNDAIQLYFGEVAGAPVSAQIVLRTGSWASAWRVGWSGEHPKLCPSKVVYWEAIRASKAAGAQFFDFLQVDPHVAELIAAGQPFDHLPMAGLTQHKLCFGPEFWRIPPTMNLFPSATPRLLMNLGGNAVLNSHLARKTFEFMRRLRR